MTTAGRALAAVTVAAAAASFRKSPTQCSAATAWGILESTIRSRILGREMQILCCASILLALDNDLPYRPGCIENSWEVHRGPRMIPVALLW
ncbi:Protein of unknown function [Gryllus bimaculatus]|nr:Protein of unknown function [Gryllus bimaculatus]